ncbi:MAG: protein TolQ [Arenicellales bacterium]
MEANQSIWHLVTNASFIVQLVMLILLVASIISWTLIFKKSSQVKRLEASADEFENEFWSVGDMNRLHQDWGNTDSEGMPAIFVAGFREYTRLAKKGDVARSEMIDGVHRAMRVVLNREMDELEHHLPFLATVGSTAPYVGLFGTVWGIMNSFRSLGAMKQVTIATVAPGISEALVATAMGLFAAIPAVIAYNRLATKAERLGSRYEIFMEEFLSIVNRQIVSKRSD